MPGAQPCSEGKVPRKRPAANEAGQDGLAEPPEGTAAEKAPGSNSGDQNDIGIECQETATKILVDPSRLRTVAAGNLRELGQKLAASHGSVIKEGLKHARGYYLDTKPISCTKTQWEGLAKHARDGAKMACPKAFEFFEGLEAELEYDVFEGLLDFEVYTLELQRVASTRKRALASSGRASSSGSSSSDSSDSSSDKSSSNNGGAAGSRSSSCSSSSCSSSKSSKSSSRSSTQRGEDADCGTSKRRPAAAAAGGSPRPNLGASPPAPGRPGKTQVRKRPASAGPSSESARSATGQHSNEEAVAEAEADAEEKKRGRPLALSSGRCTGFAFVSETSGVLAQSADLPPELYGYGDFDFAIKLETPTGKVMVYDSDGRLCPIGFNSAGLAIGVFNLHLDQTEGFQRSSVSAQAVVWELLLGQHTLASALEFLRDLKVAPMVGFALLLADRVSGAVTVEVNADSNHLVPDGVIGKLLVRSNHPLSAISEPHFGDAQSARRSSERRRRCLLTHLTKHFAKQAAGQEQKLESREKGTSGSQSKETSRPEKGTGRQAEAEVNLEQEKDEEKGRKKKDNSKDQRQKKRKVQAGKDKADPTKDVKKPDKTKAVRPFDDSLCAVGGSCSVSTEEALHCLRGRFIRNLSTLACVAIDLQKLEMKVLLRERHPPTPKEISVFTEAAKKPGPAMAKYLTEGVIENPLTKAPRIVTGMPAQHFHRWGKYAFAMNDEPKAEESSSTTADR